MLVEVWLTNSKSNRHQCKRECLCVNQAKKHRESGGKDDSAGL
jgi:hypothetical protein